MKAACTDGDPCSTKFDSEYATYTKNKGMDLQKKKKTSLFPGVGNKRGDLLILPVPDGSTNSAKNLIPCRTYQYPTKHNLAIYPYPECSSTANLMKTYCTWRRRKENNTTRNKRDIRMAEKLSLAVSKSLWQSIKT